MAAFQACCAVAGFRVWMARLGRPPATAVPRAITGTALPCLPPGAGPRCSGWMTHRAQEILGGA